MKYGVLLPSSKKFEDANYLIETAVQIEEAGWDSLFYIDDLFNYKYKSFDPLLALSSIAARTKTIRLGTWVAKLPKRDPWQFAKDIATLDQLSNGRLILGLTFGNPSESDDPNVEQTEDQIMAVKLNEFIEITTQYWTQELVNYDGVHFQIKDGTLSPKPIQQPRIPIIIGGLWPKGKAVRSGALWDGVLALSPHFPGNFTAEELTNMIEDYKTACDKLSKPPGEIWVRWNSRNSDPAMHDLAKTLGVTWLLDEIHPLLGDIDSQIEGIMKGPGPK